jgi:hypothetical protein
VESDQRRRTRFECARREGAGRPASPCSVEIEDHDGVAGAGTRSSAAGVSPRTLGTTAWNVYRSAQHTDGLDGARCSGEDAPWAWWDSSAQQGIVARAAAGQTIAPARTARKSQAKRLRLVVMQRLEYSSASALST